MIHQVKRLTQKLAIDVYRFIEPNKNDPTKNEYEGEALAICRKLTHKKSTVLLMSPISGKRYIQSEDKQINVIIDGHLVTIVNHSYSYVIPMVGKAHDRLIRMFDMEVEARRNVMEAEIRANIKHSLSNIYQNLINEQV